ncbi:MAG: glycosyltransferase [Lentisphaerae bacterium]|nr:glycosyltransferase [Lentisphaerota bacterium]
MNILHINETADAGGAAISLWRLHRALQEAGHASRVLVGWTARRGPDVAALGRQSFVSKLGYHGFNLLGLNYVGILNGRRVLRHPFVREADVIHLHNLHGGYLSYRLLPRLSRAAPLVWTLHDMWALTGHCAHGLDCVRWRAGCGRCPYPRLYPPIRRDATRWEWRLKRRLYRRARITAVCPSLWLTGLAREALADCMPVRHVPHGVDTTRFRPADRGASRRALGLPADRKVVLFAAQDVDNPYKDAPLLYAALRALDPALRERSLLLVVGGGGRGAPPETHLPVRRLGAVRDEAVLAQAYAAADVVAHPTRADNQPLVVMEALACGVPVVATEVGGIPEMVRHGETGLLAAPGDADGFRAGLEALLDDPARAAAMGARGRAFAEREYGPERWVRDMEEVYRAA